MINILSPFPGGVFTQPTGVPTFHTVVPHQVKHQKCKSDNDFPCFSTFHALLLLLRIRYLIHVDTSPGAGSTFSLSRGQVGNAIYYLA